MLLQVLHRHAFLLQAHPIESEIEPSPVRDSKVPIVFVFGMILFFLLPIHIVQRMLEHGSLSRFAQVAQVPGKALNVKRFLRSTGTST